MFVQLSIFANKTKLSQSNENTPQRISMQEKPSNDVQKKATQ